MPRQYDDDGYYSRGSGRYDSRSRRYDSSDDRRPRRQQGNNNNLIIMFVVGGIVVALLLAVGGIAYILNSSDGQPQVKAGPPVPVPPAPKQVVNPPVQPVVGDDRANNFAAAFTNKLARPVWKKHRVANYELELPGAPRTDMVMAKKKFRVELLKYELITFTDSDLELMFYVVPLPDTETRLLARFYQEFDFNIPVRDGTKDNGPLTDYMDIVRDEQVVMDGKIGWHLTFQRKPNQRRGQDMVQCRMLRMSKGVHVLVAAGNHVPEAADVVERFFNSLKVDGKQPQDPDPTKPVPLANRWRKHTDVVSGFEIDMPGVPEKSRNTKKETLETERVAVVHVDGTDLDFVVTAVRRSKREKLSDDDFFKEAKKSFLASVFDAKVVKEERIKVDGRAALELTVKTDEETIIWRVCRVPERRCEYELEVSGSKLPDYQADVDRFFASFKFQK